MPIDPLPKFDAVADRSERSRLRQQALARWENEGGAGAETRHLDGVPSNAPPLTNAEMVQLQVRVIALENLLIAVLADSSDAQRVRVRDMAAYISPRPGYTRHPLTIHAATQMLHLLLRAGHFDGEREP